MPRQCRKRPESSHLCPHFADDGQSRWRKRPNSHSLRANAPKRWRYRRRKTSIFASFSPALEQRKIHRLYSDIARILAHCAQRCRSSASPCRHLYSHEPIQRRDYDALGFALERANPRNPRAFHHVLYEDGANTRCRPRAQRPRQTIHRQRQTRRSHRIGLVASPKDGPQRSRNHRRPRR